MRVSVRWTVRCAWAPARTRRARPGSVSNDQEQEYLFGHPMSHYLRGLTLDGHAITSHLTCRHRLWQYHPEMCTRCGQRVLSPSHGAFPHSHGRWRGRALFPLVPDLRGVLAAEKRDRKCGRDLPGGNTRPVVDHFDHGGCPCACPSRSNNGSAHRGILDGVRQQVVDNHPQLLRDRLDRMFSRTRAGR